MRRDPRGIAFAAGAQLDEADIAFRLAGPRSCLGETLACLDGSIAASTNDGAVCYALPISTAEPIDCALPLT